MKKKSGQTRHNFFLLNFKIFKIKNLERKHPDIQNPSETYFPYFSNYQLRYYKNVFLKNYY